MRFDVNDEAGANLATIGNAGAAALCPAPAAGELTLQPRYQATLRTQGTLRLQPAVYIDAGVERWDLDTGKSLHTLIDSLFSKPMRRKR